ncbi:MAG: ArsR/SmtB family transcription factor [Nitrosopumilaceae archaeon]
MKIVQKMANDPHVKRLLYFVFAGSRGGLNRMRLISTLRKRPLNQNQLAKELGLDYKAIQHHIGVLEKNNLISRVGEGYGVTFFISTFLEVNIDAFNEIVNKLEKSK